jgi:hypothetical protein
VIFLDGWPDSERLELQGVKLDPGDIWAKAVESFIKPTLLAQNDLSELEHLPMGDLCLWCGGGSLALVLQRPFELVCLKFNSEYNGNVTPIWLEDPLHIVSQGAAVKEMMVCPHHFRLASCNDGVDVVRA